MFNCVLTADWSADQCRRSLKFCQLGYIATRVGAHMKRIPFHACTMGKVSTHASSGLVWIMKAGIRYCIIRVDIVVHLCRNISYDREMWSSLNGLVVVGLLYIKYATLQCLGIRVYHPLEFQLTSANELKTMAPASLAAIYKHHRSATIIPLRSLEASTFAARRTFGIFHLSSSVTEII